MPDGRSLRGEPCAGRMQPVHWPVTGGSPRHGGQLDCGIQSELILVLKIQHLAELSWKTSPEVIEKEKLQKLITLLQRPS